MKPVLTFCLALSLAAPAAHAQDFLFSFRSPTGNIHCLIGDLAEGGGAQCELVNLTPSYTKRPADCDLDWGHSFLVEAGAARGEVACVGDTVRDDGSFELDYGGTMKHGEITCTSERTGMTCVNATGHGFSISRGQQRVF